MWPLAKYRQEGGTPQTGDPADDDLVVRTPTPGIWILIWTCIYIKNLSTSRTTKIRNRTRYRGRPTSLAVFTVCLATILSMNFSNLASTPFGRGRGSWPTTSILPGTPHFSAFRDLGAPIKLPKFYDDDGLLWLKVAEAIFNFRGVCNDKRKCELLLSALDHRHLTILEFPLAHLGEHPYDELKSALLRHYAPTEEEKLHQLLYQTTLSFEQKPSELLGKMRSLMCPNVVLPPRVLRKLFLDQMPCETRKMFRCMTMRI